MALAQQMCIPAYESPSDPSNTYGYWSQFYTNAPTVAYMIATYQQGPPPPSAADYTTGIGNARTAGVRVLGYVHTTQGQRALATVETDIDAWYSRYTIDGIMLDEVQATSANLTYYTNLYNYIKAKDATRNFVALNYAYMPQVESYMSVCDVVSLFEGPYDWWIATWTSSVNSAWQKNYSASRFWAMVYTIPTQGAMQAVMDIAKAANIGMMYVTDQPAATAYSLPPSSAFWTAALAEANKTQLPTGLGGFVAHR